MNGASFLFVKKPWLKGGDNVQKKKISTISINPDINPLKYFSAFIFASKYYIA